MTIFAVTNAAADAKPNEATSTLISILKEAGYNVREKSTGRWTCTHRENGVTAEFYQSRYAPPPSVSSEAKFKHIKLRNEIGNYLMWGHGYYRIFKDGRSELQLTPSTGNPSVVEHWSKKRISNGEVLHSFKVISIPV